ncbi:MAG: MerR family transcriptional regulator [Rubrivivax sp.]|jgi:DNA-binding transcriptional MerR regulator|nr:MerR family transcriptional regulator [Rubrivivax sp.]MDP3610252.1 MerR family transcriptional regulator [Rubrivivax sp.]
MPVPPGHRAAKSLESASTAGPVACLGIVETCRRFGISLRTIRHYEAFGLLSPRRVGGARVYGAGELRALKLILRFKAIGLSLTEMRRYLRLYGLPSPPADSESADTVVEGEQALAALERRRQCIDAMLMELRLIHDDLGLRLSARVGTAADMP